MSRHVPEHRVATDCKRRRPALPVLEDVAAVILGQSQPRLTWLRRVQREGLLEQLGLAQILPVKLVLSLGIYLDRCC